MKKEGKDKAGTIEAAKGTLILTDIMNNYPNAATFDLLAQSMSKGENDKAVQTTVLQIKDKGGKERYVFKSIEFDATDKSTREMSHSEFDFAERFGSRCLYVARGLAIKERDNPDGKTKRIEMLYEHGGKSLSEWASKLSGKEIVQIAIQTIEAMALIHSENVFHSDLKLDNIVFREGVAKIIDFGISLKGEEGFKDKFETGITNKMVGHTEVYDPPEIMKYKEDRAKGKVQINMSKVDVYLWGTTFYALLLSLPKEKVDSALKDEFKKEKGNQDKYYLFKQRLSKMKLGGVDERCRREFLKLVGATLCLAPADRPSFEEMLTLWVPDLREYLSLAPASDEPKPAAPAPGAKPAVRVPKGEDMIAVLEKNDPKITTMPFQMKGIEESKAKLIAGQLKNNTIITRLLLYQNNLGDAGAAAIGIAIGENKTLSSLYLNENNFGNAGVIGIAAGLKTNVILTSLILRDNKIGGAGAQALCDALKVNKTLIELDVSKNPLEDAGINALAEALKVNKGVKMLYARATKAKEGCTKTLSAALCVNTTLHTLDFSENELGPAGAKNLESGIEGSASLSILVLDTCKLGVAGASGIVEAAKKMKVLTKINLRFNGLTPDLIAKVKASAMPGLILHL